MTSFFLLMKIDFVENIYLYIYINPQPTIVPYTSCNASVDAETLRAAMKGLGTDEEEILQLLTARSNGQRQEIAAKFGEMFERDLVDDLKSELGGSFETVVVALMSDPVEFLCAELHAAMDGCGTSESVLIEVLCTWANGRMKQLVEKYEEGFFMSIYYNVIMFEVVNKYRFV